MGYCVEAVAVDLEQLKRVLGCRDERLFEHLVGRIGADDDEQPDSEDSDDDETPTGCTRKECLRHLIMGEPFDADSGSTYAWTIADIAKFLGEFLPNENWCGMPRATEWITTVDESLGAIGVPEASLRMGGHLLYRGAPIDIPEYFDWPMMGYLTLAEVRAARKLLASAPYKKLDDSDVVASIEELHGWLDHCDANEFGLLCTCG